MRFLLILVMLAALGGLAWHAVTTGTAYQRAAGAPQVHRYVDTTMRAAVAEVTADAVKVTTDGRNVTLAGQVSSADVRDQVLEAANDVYLLGRLTDDIKVVNTISPYTFAARLSQDGLSLDGFVPDRATEDRLLAEARRLSGGNAVSANLAMASGVPEGDWVGLAATGLAALVQTGNGTLEISDMSVVLTGQVTDPAVTEQIQALAATAPAGDWTLNLSPVPPADSPQFSAMKTPDGAMMVDGFVPNDQVRSDLLALIQDLTKQPVLGNLQVSGGATAPDWQAQASAALQALETTESGLLSISQGQVTLTADVKTDADRAALGPMLQDGWSTEIQVLNPAPVGDMTVVLAADGSTRAEGNLPKGTPVQLLFAMLPGVDVSDVVASDETTPEDWTAALEGLAIVLPRFQTAKARLVGKRLVVSGTLKRGYTAAGSQASLRTVLDRAWTLEVDLKEMAPPASVVLSKRADEVSLSGVLPQGLAPDEALSSLGPDAGGNGLTSGGEGDAAIWRDGLAALGQGMDLFREASAELTPGSVELDGVLQPGYTANDAQTWISTQMGEAWAVGLTGEETPASDGDQRVSLTTSQPESFRNGYWLPDVDFPVSAPRCKQEIDAVLTSEKILFVTGSATIDQKGRTLLNRLAAVAVRCLNSSVLTLEIGGHTDASGNDENNQRLSEARAQAVLTAMQDRGVRADAMRAAGFGESQPIATNDTSEGRAQNRRITFQWFESDG